MQYEVINYLKCPLKKTNLHFTLLSEFEKSYQNDCITEIKDGLLFSETGFVFPIIDGIPRMLLEAVYDYSDFLEKHLPNYNNLLQNLEKKYSGLLQYCIKKNSKTKQSFALEWSFLRSEKQDKVWHQDATGLSTVFFNETGEHPDYFKGKRVIDVGCGHGIMTSSIAVFAALAFGVELSRAVEHAYTRNQNRNAWYIQGDLQFLPFEDTSFDVLYSSGVIHHTNNTELSLSLIEPVLKPGGAICLWLYHPQQDTIHNFMLRIWQLTRRMPVQLAFAFILIFIFPVTFLIKKIKNKDAPNYREEIIDLLDAFTPEFRFEIPHDLAITWLQRRKYHTVRITTTNQFGFSIAGKKGSGSVL